MSLITVNYGARSLKVKASPGMLLNEILVRSCNHFKLDSDKWTLKHGKSNIDLSLPVRLSGLSAGTKLELVERPDGAQSDTPSKITLKLQILDSSVVVPADVSLLIGQFDTRESVVNILRHFEGRTGLDLLNRIVTETDASQSVQTTTSYKPIVQSFTRTLSTESELQKPVSDLGFSSGNVVLRVKFEKLVVETLRLKPENAPEETVPSKLSTDEPASIVDSEMDVDEPPPEDKLSAISSPDSPALQAEAVAQEKEISEIKVFVPSQEPIKAAATEDSTYELSISQAKKYQAMLQKKAGSGPMLSQRMRQQTVAPVKPIDSCEIRVRFPDWTSIQFSLEPSKTLGDLYASVLEFIVEQSGAPSDGMLFHLSTTHPHQILNRTENDLTKKLVADLDFGQRTVLVFEDLENVPRKRYLKSQYLENAKPISEAAEVQLDHSRSELEDTDNEAVEEPSVARRSTNSQMASSSTADGIKKMPKWLKFK